MWAFLKSLPSQFWDSLLNGLKRLKEFLSGAIVMKLWDTLQRSKKLNEQFAAILEAERKANKLPVAGAADKLRNSRLNRSRERGIL